MWGNHVIFIGFLPNPRLVGAVCGGVCGASGCADAVVSIFAVVGRAIHRYHAAGLVGGGVGFAGVVAGRCAVVLRWPPLWAAHLGGDVQDFHLS